MSKIEASEVKESVKPTPTGDEFMYVSIPLTDLFDQPHPGVRLNRIKFEAGRTYSVRADVAIEVEDRLKKFNIEQVRLLRPNADRKSLNEVNRGSQWTSRTGGVSTLEGGLSSVAGPNDKVFIVDF
jgi:hypothetical protein